MRTLWCATLAWGLCPQTPRIYRFFPARMDRSDLVQGTGLICPPPFRLLNRSLGLLPSIALSRPFQVIPEWTISTSPCNTHSANGDNSLNFVSHSRGSVQPFHRTLPPLMSISGHRSSQFTLKQARDLYRVYQQGAQAANR